MGKRQTYYFKTLEEIKEIASEEQIEANGAMFERLFWEKYVGYDKNYQCIMKELYEGSKNLRQAIIATLDIMAHSKQYMSFQNVEFVKLVRDMIGAAVWNSSNDEYLDCRISDRKKIVNNIADILVVISKELDYRLNLVVQTTALQKIQPWELPVKDNRYSEILNDKCNYDPKKIAYLKIGEEKFRSELCADNICPSRMLDLLIENWQYLWSFDIVYEAIQYCVILSDRVIDKPILRKNMRDFFRTSKRRDL